MYYEEKKRRKEKLILYCFMTVIISLLLILILRTEVNEMQTNPEYQSEKINYETNTISDENISEGNSKANLDRVINSVVGISKLKKIGSSIFVDNAEEKLGLGSGTIITDNGYILTNQHVAGNKFSNCYVTLNDGNVYEGSVVWADSNVDLAIVKIEKNGLEYIELGDSDSLSLAEDVYAIGNPLGLDFQNTITKGIISSLNRTIKIEDDKENVYMEDLIQTDTTINEGNSGGALIDSSGKLIGINTVKISNADGIGFAVPINIVKPIINKLVTDGKFDEAWLGIYGYENTKKEIEIRENKIEAIKYLDSNIKIESGIYVAQIAQNGPLVGMDVREGDIITQIDDVKINKMNDLKKYIYTKSPNDFVTLYIQRESKNYTVSVKLASKN